MDGTKIVRRNFTFPAGFDEKIEKLMAHYGAASKSELLRMALNAMEKEAREEERERERV